MLPNRQSSSFTIVVRSDNSQRGTGGFGSSYEDVEGSFHPSLFGIRSIEEGAEHKTSSAGTIGAHSRYTQRQR